MTGSRHIVQGFHPSASFAHPVIVGLRTAGRGRAFRGKGFLWPFHSWKYFAHCGAYFKAGHSKNSAHIAGSISSVCDLLSGIRECSVYLFQRTYLVLHCVCNHTGHDSAWNYPSLCRETAPGLGMCLTILLICFKPLMWKVHMGAERCKSFHFGLLAHILCMDNNKLML